MKFAITLLLSTFVVLAATRSSSYKPFCVCTREFTPICGTDGNTYPNKCEFKCRQSWLSKTKGAELKIAKIGSCDDPVPASESTENTESIDNPDIPAYYVN